MKRKLFSVLLSLVMLLLLFPAAVSHAEVTPLTPEYVTGEGNQDGTVTSWLFLPETTEDGTPIVSWTSKTPSVLLVDSIGCAYPLTAKTDKTATLAAALEDGSELTVDVTVPKKENWETWVDQNFESTNVGDLPTESKAGVSWARGATDTTHTQSIGVKEGTDGGKYLAVNNAGIGTAASETMFAYLRADTGAYDRVKVSFKSLLGPTEKDQETYPTGHFRFSTTEIFDNTWLRVEIRPEELFVHANASTSGVSQIPYAQDEWHTYDYVIDQTSTTSKNTFTLSVDNEPQTLNSNQKKFWKAGKLKSLNFGTIRNLYVNLAIDDVKLAVDTIRMSDGTNALNSLAVPSFENLTGNVTLPTAVEGAKGITWISSNPSVIDEEGNVTQTDKNESVTLYAVAELNQGGEDSCYYAKAYQASVLRQGLNITVGDITGDENGNLSAPVELPATTSGGQNIIWSVSNSDLTKMFLLDGTLYPLRTNAEQSATLTATIPNGDEPADVLTFTIKIPQAVKYLVNENFESVNIADGETIPANWRYRAGIVTDGYKQFAHVTTGDAENETQYLEINSTAALKGESVNVAADTTGYDTVEVQMDVKVVNTSASFGFIAKAEADATMSHKSGFLNLCFARTYFQNAAIAYNDSLTKPCPAGQWNTLKYVFDKKNGKVSLDINGVNAVSGAARAGGADNIKDFLFTNPLGATAQIDVDNFSVAVDGSVMVKTALEGITLSGTELTENVTLPQTVGEKQILWSSSDTSVIGNDGTIHRAVGDRTATLYALTEADGIWGMKTFNVTVKSLISIATDENTATASFNLDESTAGENAVLILAAYNGDSMTAVSTKNCTFPAQEIPTLTLDLTDKTYTELRAFVWKNLTTLQPAVARTVSKK